MQILPVKFPEANKVLTPPVDMTEDECSNLHVFNDDKISISCWEITDEVLELIQKHRKIWLGVTAGKSQPPVWMSPDETPFIKEDNG